MSDLDDKLKQIWEEEIESSIQYGEGVGAKYYGIERDDVFAQIKQAFADEGYSTPVDKDGIINFGTEEHPVLIHKDSLPFSPESGGGYIDIPKDLRLTGQEWAKSLELWIERQLEFNNPVWEPTEDGRKGYEKAMRHLRYYLEHGEGDKI